MPHRLDLAALTLEGETRAAHNVAMQWSRGTGPHNEQQTDVRCTQRHTFPPSGQQINCFMQYSVA
jgi:hypothetical protein